MQASKTGTVPLFTEVGLLIKNRMQRVMPLPFAQCQALWFVTQEGRPNMQDVAKHFKITAPSATFLIDELVRAGYLARRPSASDRRKVELVLTQKGKRESKMLQEKRGKILDGIFKSLSAADRQDLNRILQKIISNA